MESLQTRVTSIWKKDEITSVFAELSRIEKPEGQRVRNALEYTRLQIPGFDYRAQVGLTVNYYLVYGKQAECEHALECMMSCCT
jgi:hypothetical protein